VADRVSEVDDLDHRADLADPAAGYAWAIGAHDEA
jgi:hypothetical protein